MTSFDEGREDAPDILELIGGPLDGDHVEHVTNKDIVWKNINGALYRVCYMQLRGRDVELVAKHIGFE